MAHRLTKEEKVASKLVDLVGDVTLDLDMVGWYIAKSSPTILINRLSLVVEAAVDQREEEYGNGYTY